MVHRSKLGSYGSKFLSIWRESKAKRLMVHVDNAPAHNSKTTRNSFEQNPLKRLSHPPHSPNTFPSDFSPFGTVKGVLIRQEIPDEISLLDAVTEILNGTSTDELQRVFRS
jgi:hypothetical protein